MQLGGPVQEIRERDSSKPGFHRSVLQARVWVCAKRDASAQKTGIYSE